MIGKMPCVSCRFRELLDAEKQRAEQVVDSPLSSQLKAKDAPAALKASRCERVSRRYNERVFVILTDAF